MSTSRASWKREMGCTICVNACAAVEHGIENAPADGAYPPGTLAMARTQDPNSNGGQFFIVYDDTTLPVDGGGYSIFGRVTEGLEIVQAVADQGVDGGRGDGAPAQPISILSVDVED